MPEADAGRPPRPADHRPGDRGARRRAGLAGVAAEAGRAILVGRDETIDAFRRAGLFLVGIAPVSRSGHG